MKKRKCLEDSELIKFFDYVRFYEKKFPEFAAIFHVPNERKCTVGEAVKLERKGVKAGILDVLALIPTKEYHGLIMEFKTEKGKLSPEQQALIKIFHALGFCVRIARSSEEGIRILRSYLQGIPVHKPPTLI